MVGVHVSIPLSIVNLTGHVFANGGHLCYSIFQPLKVVNLTVPVLCKCVRVHVNPIRGRLLATPISGKGGLFRTPLDISGSYRSIFFKFKRHSFRLNMIYISKK